MENYKKELDDIRKMLLKNPRGLTISEISEKLKVNRNSVAKYMDVLRVIGTVEKKEVGPSKIFYLSQKLPISAIIDASQDAIVCINKDLKIVRINKNFNNVIPFGKDFILGQKLNEEPFKQLFTEIEPELNKAINGKEIKKEIVLNKGNKEAYFNVKITPSQFEDTSMGLTLVIEDITEKKILEQKLKESKEESEALVKYAPTAIYELEFDPPKFISVNDAMVNMTGYSRDEILSMSPLDFLDDESKELFKRRIKDITSGNKPDNDVEYHVKTRDGRLLSVLLNVTFNYANKEKRSALVIGHDITERKKAEEKLIRNERELRKSQEIAKLGTWHLDLHKNLITWSPETYNLFGVNPDTFVVTPETIMSLIHTEDRDFVNKTYSNSLRERKNYDISYRIITPKKEIVYIREICDTIYNKEGRPLGYIGIVQDITKAKEAEEEIRKSRENYKNIVETANEGIIVGNPDGRFIFVNQKFSDMMDYTKEELLGKRTIDFTDEEQKIKVINARKELKEGKLFTGELKLKRKDGSVLWTHTNASPLYDSEGKYLGNLVMHADITERKKAEEELLKLNRTLKSISDSRKLFTFVDNEEEYLQDICKIIIEDCNYEMVWIGFAENDEQKAVRPVAQAGFEEGYLKVLDITWSKDSERGRGPTGTAIRTGKPVICKNMLTDSDFKPWREEATQRGYASSIVLPMINSEKAFGAVNIYSKEPDPFTEKEVQMLLELTEDISRGIILIRNKVEKMKAEKEIISLSRFPSENPYPTLRINKEGTILYANPSSEEFLNNYKLKIGDSSPKFIRTVLADALRLQKSKEVGVSINGKDFIFSIVPIKDMDYANVYGIDITNLGK